MSNESTMKTIDGMSSSSFTYTAPKPYVVQISSAGNFLYKLWSDGTVTMKVMDSIDRKAEEIV